MSIARAYVKALFEVVEQGPTTNGNGHGGHHKAELADARAQLASFQSILDENNLLRKALCTQATSSEEKARIVSALLKGQAVAPVVVRFLDLLARNRRLTNLPEIITQFDHTLLEAEGGVLGLAESADVLSDKALQALAESFEKRLGKRVEFKNTVDPALLAGLRVTVSGVTFDGTLRGQLERLREKFSA